MCTLLTVLTINYAVQHVLAKPTVKGLEDDDNMGAAQEPVGLDYSSPWHESFVNNRLQIEVNLHMLHPSMQTVLQMGQAAFGNLILINCHQYR
jgi:dynein heavy chain, axonemal